MPSGVGRYRLGPFLLASEIELPELENAAECLEPAQVSISLGKVPDRLQQVVANETRWWAAPDEYLLRVPGVANFLVRHGREVIVEPAADALPGDIRAYLLAPIFSILCYQSGMFSLHASSVRVGGGVAAFLGNSGAGKSTLAAYLERRGHAVVSDDICLLEARGEDAKVRVVPVAPALKLWRSALEQLGASPAEFPQVFSRDDKYRMKIGEMKERLPLRLIYFLEWSPEGDAAIALEPAHGVQAITRLMEFMHQEYLMKPTGRQGKSFLFCGRMLEQVRAFTFRRPRDFGQMDCVMEALGEHLSTWAEG